MMDDIDREFTWWQNALKGERGPIDGDNPRAGYYRSKAKDKTLGAVAYWYDSNSSELRCQQNGRDIDDLRAREMWPHVSRRPIAEDVFWHFRDTGVWKDIDEAAQIPAAEIVRAGMAAAEVAAPYECLTVDIAVAKDSAAKYAKVESDEEMALAQSLRGKLQELAGKADKLRTEEKEPFLTAGREVDEKWQPMIKVAKAAADGIRKALEGFNDWKLEQSAKAAAATAMAESQGATRPVASNAPPPSTQIRGGGSRAASVTVKPVVTAVDLDKAFKQFRDAPELEELFIRLAQRAIDAGLPCEAATVERKSVVR